MAIYKCRRGVEPGSAVKQLQIAVRAGLTKPRVTKSYAKTFFMPLSQSAAKILLHKHEKKFLHLLSIIF